jgi:hypothetical protein
MEIRIDVVVDVDAGKSAQHFGVAPTEVEPCVQAHLAALVHAELQKLGLGVSTDTTADGGAVEFRDDDAGYLAWLAAHQDGYVVNVARSHTASDARLHHVGCRTISSESPPKGTWTGAYVKVCADRMHALEQWAIDHVSRPIKRCGTCRPGGDDLGRGLTEPVTAESHCDIDGPTVDSATVDAWADEYIRFERRPEWQELLRAEIRRRCGQLTPSSDEVLHATFFGAKPPNADIENLLLYNIDTFRAAGRNGIRCEYGAAAPEGRRRFGYRYALARRWADFDHWRQGRTLASFDWTDLGPFVGEKKLAQVWFALACGDTQASVSAPAPATPFAVKVEIRPPLERQPVWGGLVKGVVDGVVCAFQAHTDTSILPDVVARLSKDLPAHPADIERCLLDQRRAVLGAVPQLVSPYRSGVKWDPADHRCVAGEVLAADPVDARWAIRGELVELHR